MNNRRNGKIARLPNDVREVVNKMIRDGAELIRRVLYRESSGVIGSTRASSRYLALNDFMNVAGDNTCLRLSEVNRS